MRNRGLLTAWNLHGETGESYWKLGTNWKKKKQSQKFYLFQLTAHSAEMNSSSLLVLVYCPLLVLTKNFEKKASKKIICVHCALYVKSILIFWYADLLETTEKKTFGDFVSAS